ncbi:hypothetical protein GCM10022227_22270 [Streptomyces sedi]
MPEAVPPGHPKGQPERVGNRLAAPRAAAGAARRERDSPCTARRTAPNGPERKARPEVNAAPCPRRPCGEGELGTVPLRGRAGAPARAAQLSRAASRTASATAPETRSLKTLGTM